MAANLKKSDAAWKRYQTISKRRAFANRTDAIRRSGSSARETVRQAQ